MTPIMIDCILDYELNKPSLSCFYQLFCPSHVVKYVLSMCKVLLEKGRENRARETETERLKKMKRTNNKALSLDLASHRMVRFHSW